MATGQVVIFIHGLGAARPSREHQVAALPGGFQGLTVAVPCLSGAALPKNEQFTLRFASAELLSKLDRRHIDRAHLCGVSLSAMIALGIAADHSERVRSLMLAAYQVKPPR